MLNIGHHRAAHAHGVVVARRVFRAGVVAVVVQIDATDKRGVGVDHRQLAVQAAQAAAARPPAQHLGAKKPHIHPGRAQGVQPVIRKIRTAKAIQQHIDFHPATGGGHQRAGNALASGVDAKDIGFQLDLPPGGVQAGQQRRKKLGAVAQQSHRIVAP